VSFPLKKSLLESHLSLKFHLKNIKVYVEKFPIENLFFLLPCHTKQSHPRKIPPGKIPLGKIPPWKNSPWRNLLRRVLHEKIPPGKIPLGETPLGEILSAVL
jgi:hypothetical protein